MRATPGRRCTSRNAHSVLILILLWLPRESSHAQHAGGLATPLWRDAPARGTAMPAQEHVLRMRGGKPRESGNRARDMSRDPAPTGHGKLRGRRAFPAGHKSGRAIPHDSSDSDEERPKPAVPALTGKLAGLKGALQARINGAPLPASAPCAVKKPRAQLPDEQDAGPAEAAAGDADSAGVWGLAERGRAKKVRQGSFEAIGLSPELVKGMYHAGSPRAAPRRARCAGRACRGRSAEGPRRAGYKFPTPVQRKVVPRILGGGHLVAMARTGPLRRLAARPEGTEEL